MPPSHTPAPSRPAVRFPAWHSSGLSLVVVLVVVTAVVAQGPPAAVAATAPSEVFSAERAYQHLLVLAAEPHPIGSAANRRVRDHLLLTLDELGLRREVQRTPVVGTRFGGAAVVENVLGRLPGSGAGAAVLLVAHYDSVPGAPGAADNGAAVVAILETLRALGAGPRLTNDVMVLFSDGEEMGLLGAEAFVAEHPWMADVGMVLNFEARGSSGPSVLVETSGPSTELMRAFAATVRYPNASSLASAVYDLLPNDTDFSVFKPLGIPGLNFAFIREAAHYHTARDAIDTVSLRSLQHHGEHMLALTRRFGDADLTALASAEGDSVYVDVLRRRLLHYPTTLVWPLALLALAAWVAVVVRAWRRRQVRLRDVAGGTFTLMIALVVVVALGVGLFALLGRLQPALATRWLAAPYGAETSMVGFALAAILATLLVTLLARRWLSPLALALGGALVWVALALAAAALLPGGSYLPTLTVLGLLLGLGLVVTSRDEPGSAPWHPWALLAGALPGLLLLPPFLAEGFIGLGLGLAAPILALVTLATWLLTPLLDALRGPRWWLLPSVLLVASVGTLGLGASRAVFGPQQPRPSNAFYAVDPDRAIALFGSLQDEPDAWTARFVDREQAPAEWMASLLPTAPPMRYGAAPVVDLPSPLLEVLDDQRDGATRTLTLRLAPGREAATLLFLVAPAAGVWDFHFEGRFVELERIDGWQRTMVFGPPQEGVEVRFSTAAATPLELVLSALSHDLLDLPGAGVPARPPGLMAAPSTMSDAVLVSRRWRFEAAD